MYGSTPRLVGVQEAFIKKGTKATKYRFWAGSVLCLILYLLFLKFQRLSVLQQDLQVRVPTFSYGDKISWDIFLDLQCPFSKITFDKLEDYRTAFGHKFDINLHLQAIPFHLSAFQGNMGAAYVKKAGDQSAYESYIGSCFDSQQSFLNNATLDMTHRQIFTLFAEKALTALQMEISPESVSEMVANIQSSGMSAYNEFKQTINEVNFGAPHFVVGGKYIPASSSWGVSQWDQEFRKLGNL